MFVILVRNSISDRTYVRAYEWSGAVQFFDTREAAQLRIDAGRRVDWLSYEIIAA